MLFNVFRPKSRLQLGLMLILLLTSYKSPAQHISVDELNLVDSPADSVQHVLWDTFPLIIHRRTPAQLMSLRDTLYTTPSSDLRFLSYQTIARTHGNEFASAIMEFTEHYITQQNVYMSEIPEFGIYSQVSPVSGCTVGKTESGFLDPCRGIAFDHAGKVVNNDSVKHMRLLVPPHKIVNNKLVLLDDYKAKKLVDFTPDILNMDITPIEKALYAIDFENLDILKQIVKQHPKVITQQNDVGTTLVQMAAYHDKTLDYLLSMLSNEEYGYLQHVNKAGYNALMFAVWNEKHENAKKLIAAGATTQSYLYENETVPSIYEFMLAQRSLSANDAEEVHSMLLAIEKNTQRKSK